MIAILLGAYPEKSPYWAAETLKNHAFLPKEETFAGFEEDIKSRTSTLPAYGPSMPLIGITEIHTEGIDLIHEYMDSL